MNAYLNWKAPGARPEANARSATASKVAARFASERLSEREAGELFTALGIKTADSEVLGTGSRRLNLPGPYAVKVLSPDIPHKTDAGLVALEITREDVPAIVDRTLEAARTRFPKARIDGVLVQQMEYGLAEVILGFRRDPEVGPVVVLGMGGIAAELRRIISVRVAPVSPETAREMIGEIRELDLLRGFRNLPPGDCAALAEGIVAMSMLAHVTPSVSEAEVNPLIVKAQGRGVVAVDGLVVFEKTGDRPRFSGQS